MKHASWLPAFALLFTTACAEQSTGQEPLAENELPVLFAKADGPLASSVRRTHIYFIEPALYSQYFSTRLHAEPQWTPDGGAFQFFQGEWGLGAIYAHLQSNGATVSAPIYGDILPTWARYGYETVIGYPESHEQDATDRSERHRCRSEGGHRQQAFGYVRWSHNGFGNLDQVVLCWSPERGTWLLPTDVERALNEGGEVQRHDP